MDIIREGHEYNLQDYNNNNPPNSTICNDNLIQSLIFVMMDDEGNYHRGTTNEEVLAVLIDRMEYLNEKFPCEENLFTIHHLGLALDQLEKRTIDRLERGVEGKHKP